VSHNTTGVDVQQAASSTASVLLERSTLNENTTGINLHSTAAAYSRLTNGKKFNTFKYNGTDVTGGSLTLQSGQ
jgi:hypothetical protein